MVEVIDVVKGRCLLLVQSAAATGQKVIELIEQKTKAPADSFFLMSEAGDVLSAEAQLPSVCLFFNREELLIDDRDLASGKDWAKFKKYPPGDWYTEAFDFDRWDDFSDPRLQPIPGLEKRLFKCQEEAKRMYATYKESFDTYKKYEYAAVWRIKAAVAIISRAKKDFKFLDRVYAQIAVDPLPESVISDYKEKQRELLQRPAVIPQQASLCQLFLDLAKSFIDCRNKLEGKVSKVKALISKQRDTLRKVSNTVSNRKGTILQFFDGMKAAEALTKEPLLAVAVATIRNEYTKFRDLFSKLMHNSASAAEARAIASRLSTEFTANIAEFEQELEKCNPCVTAMKEAESAASTENDRGRGALTLAIDNCSLAVAKIKMKILKRQGKIADLQARLARYRKFLTGGDGDVLGSILMPDQQLGVYENVMKEHLRQNESAQSFRASIEALKAKIKSEKEARSAFLQSEENLQVYELYHSALAKESAVVAVAGSENKANSPAISAKQSKLQTAFERAKKQLSREIEDLEKAILAKGLDLEQCQYFYARLESEKQSLVHQRKFLARSDSYYRREIKLLANSQTDYLEAANILSRYR